MDWKLLQFQGSKNSEERKKSINFRTVIAIREIGKVLTAIESFCRSMNMPPPMQSNAYNNTVLSLRHCYVCASQESMITAASETTASLERKTPGYNYKFWWDMATSWLLILEWRYCCIIR